jgi:hypothetical protein
VQNLLYDLSQTTIPFDPVDAEDLAKTAKMGGPGNCAIHVVSGTDQFCFRSGNVRFALMDFRREQPAKTVLLSIGLVGGGPAVTDSDRPYDWI